MHKRLPIVVMWTLILGHMTQYCESAEELLPYNRKFSRIVNFAVSMNLLLLHKVSKTFSFENFHLHGTGISATHIYEHYHINILAANMSHSIYNFLEL